jgi:hypothetical protein
MIFSQSTGNPKAQYKCDTENFQKISHRNLSFWKGVDCILRKLLTTSRPPRGRCGSLMLSNLKV